MYRYGPVTKSKLSYMYEPSGTEPNRLTASLPLLRFCSHAGKEVENWHPDAPVPRGLQRQQILATRDPYLSLVCAYQ